MRLSGRIVLRYGILTISVYILLTFIYVYGFKSDSGKHSSKTDSITHHIRTESEQEGVKKLGFLPEGNNDYKPTLDLIPKTLSDKLEGKKIRVQISVDDFRKSESIKTGNPLIDLYGESDYMLSGEYGRGLTFVAHEKDMVEQLMNTYHVNVYASDLIPLNRHVPDSRTAGCQNLKYEHDLPTASIIIPFYNEWPSTLLRTVYSVINRTPRHLLKEILLIDDASTEEILKDPLDEYIENHFPKGLVRITHLPTRVGLIQARIKAWKQSRGDVIVIFDSHMEVNVDWLQPLLTEIKKDRKTVAMGVLDYINAGSLEYFYNRGYLTRYGFDWNMVFFETFFRQDQIGPKDYSPRPGTVMVGAAFAIDKLYFGEIGTYDEGMKVWGGENLELSWRVWSCGGKLVHLPCSHFGHIARSQPYSFPGGRKQIELFNYKRAAEVWMGPYKEFIYQSLPDIMNIDVGDISERLALKEKLQCKNITWFLHNIWPELAIYNENVQAWGSAKNLGTGTCLDNHNYLFQAPEKLYSHPCHFQLGTQGFTLTKDNLFKTTLQCVVAKVTQPMLEDCIIGPKDKWSHVKDGYIQHIDIQSFA
ncbi:hypothetical protein SNE40_012152 [Patella caerulea]|uniref:Polypeptide N-acetylgalactosaminyltransferase n=2 Tax=Patella caerulea TaxID=87958 RepID=A0AAN8JP92_PATCE